MFNNFFSSLFMTLMLFSLMFAKSFIEKKDTEFDYDTNGPDTWFIKSPMCGGSAQSPINIETASVEYNSALQPLDFSIYDNTFTWKIFEPEHNSMQI